MGYTVFISHSTKDEKAVAVIRQYLEGCGHSCFVSGRDLKHNDVWQAQLVSAMDSSKMLLYVHSVSSNASAEVCREINYFSDKCHRPVLVYRLSDEAYNSDRAYYLQSINYIDSLDKVESGLEQLASNVKDTLEGKTAVTYSQKVSRIKKSLVLVLMPVAVVLVLAAAGLGIYRSIHNKQQARAEACIAQSEALLTRAGACLADNDSLALGLELIEQARDIMAECNELKTVSGIETPDFDQLKADYITSLTELRQSRINTVKGLYEPLKYTSKENMEPFVSSILSSIEGIHRLDSLLSLAPDPEIEKINLKILDRQ